ncbi:MAG: corrinoid protein [Candidatus Methylomirabilales bacterium]
MSQELTQMETPELLELMMDDLYDGLAEEVVQEVEECLRREMPPYDVMTDGLVAGMEIVGVDFRDGVLFVPEVLMAAKAMKAGMEILRPLLADTGSASIGKAVIGTVKGDIHDIGKNLVKMMWEGAGIEVVDLGINTDAETFLQALEEHGADILGMSALLTTTMPYMKVVIDELKTQGVRDRYTVLVGGAPLNEAFAEDIEADFYCRDAAVAVETAKKVLAVRRGEGAV